MEKNAIGMASSSEAVVDIESVEHRPLIMDRDSVDLEAGPGDQPQCRICLESDGNSSKPLVWLRTREDFWSSNELFR